MTSSFTARAIARVLPLVFAAASMPSAAAAQTAQEIGTETARPAGFTANVGWQSEYDDNVFRSADEKMADAVSRLGASTGVHAQLSRFVVSGAATFQWVHYATLISERGANLGSSLKFEFPFARFTPYVSTVYNNTRDRVENEIDTRPRSERSSIAFGGLVRLGGKTGIDVNATRSAMSFDKSAIADGVNLSEALDRTSNTMSVTLSQEVTPITRLTFGAEMQRDTFSSASFRSSDEARVTVGFQSDGRIKGSARGGLRIFKPHAPNLTESRGLFLAVSTDMTLKDRLQVSLGAQSDFAPSYRPGITYFDATSYGVTMSYAIRQSLRLSGSAGLYRSDYTDEPFAAFGDLYGLDTEVRYGSGISYTFANALTLDVAGTYTERTSPLTFRRFDGRSIRAGVSHAF